MSDHIASSTNGRHEDRERPKLDHSPQTYADGFWLEAGGPGFRIALRGRALLIVLLTSATLYLPSDKLDAALNLMQRVGPIVYAVLTGNTRSTAAPSLLTLEEETPADSR